MKFKILCVVLVLFLLTGCGQEQPELSSLSDMSFTVHIVSIEDKYICSGMLKGTNLTLEVQEPSTLKGLIITFNEAEVLIQHLGLKQSILTDEFPKNSPLMLLYSAIIEVNNGDLETSDKKNYEVHGEIENEKFEFVFSPAMLPVSVEIEGLNFKSIFSNVTVEKTP